MENKFIVFEGLDGSGKDTQLIKFAQYLRETNKYLNIWITREPTTITPAGKILNQKLKEHTLTMDEALKYYIEDRKLHLKTIINYLETSWVLCSRYDISTYIYQTTQGASFETIKSLHKGIKIPDVTLFFEATVETLLKRIGKRGKKEYFETKTFLEKAHKNSKEIIQKLKSKRTIITIDADNPVDVVFKEMISKLKSIKLI